MYGVLERQFRNYYKKASQVKGSTGENLLRMLESRLDNVVYRLGIAATRRQARQFVAHGHIHVNGRRIDVPSYRLSPGDEIEVAPNAKKNAHIKGNVEERRRGKLNPWLEFDEEALKGRFLHRPAREDLTVPVNELQVIEYYSR
jgi:small subunit ribosomal protein S4